MKWCCHAVRNAFESRLEVGGFMVAGYYESVGEVWFFAGANMAHRKDWSNVLSANKAVGKALKAEGISNLKLQFHHVVHFCSHCGAKLRDFYGNGGGALRDDEYLAELKSSS